MLTSFRKGAHSFPAKILLIFLVLTFALWGVGDVFRGAPDNVVAKVGDELITTQELEFSIRNAQTQIPELTPEVAQSLPVKLQFLQRIINSRLLELEAKSLGVHFSRDALSERIANDPIFHDDEGRFSKERFVGLLRQSNQSEGSFMQRFATDMKIALLHATIAESVMIRPELARLYYHVQHEKREAKLIVFDASDAPAIKAPSEDDVKALYDEIGEQFREPEYRTYRFVYFNGDMIAKSLSDAIGDAELKRYYEAHLDEFLGDDGKPMAFDKAKPLIEQLLSEQFASEKLIDLSGQLDDAIAGGSSLEEALKGAGLSQLKVETLGPISSGGALKNGELYEMTGVEEEMLKTAYEQDAGEISPITISADHYYYLVETLEVSPSFVPEFEAIRGELAAIITDERKREALRIKTDALAKELQEAENPVSAAKERGLTLRDIGTIDRSTQKIRLGGKDIPLTPAFMQALYQLRPNEVSDTVSLGNQQGALIVLTRIVEAKEPDSEALAPIEEALKRQMGEAALESYLNALRDKFGVELFMDKIVTQSDAMNGA